MDATDERHWQIKCSGVRQRTSQLYQLGQWTDCEFRVGAEAASVTAHRLVLAIASPVFEAMFYGALAHKDNAEPIDVPDMQVEAFNALLQYIYTDMVKIPSRRVAYELYNLGQKYMLPKLQSESLQYLQKNLNPDNAGFTYEFAQLFDQKELAEQCLEVIKNETLKVLKSDSFTELHIDTVNKIFSLEPLNIRSELDLYDAAVEHTTFNVNDRDTMINEVAKTHTSLINKVAVSEPNRKKRKTDDVTQKLAEPDTDGTEKGEKDVTVAVTTNEDLNDKIGDPPELPLRKAVKHIRFLTMDPREFSDHDFSLFLSQSEILAILLNLTSTTTHTPMPSGFSTNRKSRIKISKGSDAGYEKIVFRTTVSNIHRRIQQNSKTYYLRGFPCQLEIEISYENGKKTLTVYLNYNWYDISTWKRHLHVTFRLLSNRADISPLCKEMEQEFGNPGVTFCGASITWDKLMPPESFITDDSITLEVEVREIDKSIGTLTPT